MQKVLRKRIIRDLKENIMRYMALGLLVVLCMYIVVSLLGTADTFIIKMDEYKENYNVEDGQFKVFVPLTDTQISELENIGAMIESQFYIDFRLDNEAVVRVFQDRKLINKVHIEYGRNVENEQEIVLEKRYCEEQNIEVGHRILIAGCEFEVVGIGCSPDYESPLKEFSDTATDSENFTTAFVTQNQYNQLLKSGKSIKAEEYVYAYSLDNDVDENKIKDKLSEYTVEIEDMEDEYFKEYWNEQIKDKEEFENGINDLAKGADSLSAGIDELAELKTGIEAFDTGLINAKNGAKDVAEGVGKLKECSEEFLEEYFDIGIGNLMQFTPAKDNVRIGTTAADQIVNKYCGLVAGVILIILFAYVISVFVIYGIEKEATTIGALYALGVKRGELIRNYLYLPVIITLFGGIVGTVLGFSPIGVKHQMVESYLYFSIPQVDIVYPAYILIYAVVLPPVLAALVNWMVIGKKLKRPPLQLLRNEKTQNKIKNVNIRGLGFIATFRVRQMIREMRTAFTVVVGMFISLLVLMIGVNCYALCKNISVDQKLDTKYEYMYTYKYPQNEVPEGGYEAYAKVLKKENLGYNFDVTVLGLTKDNPFFDVELTNSKSEVIISSAMAQKYGLKRGESFVAVDESVEQNYAFNVTDIAQYSTGFYVFMDIDSARELFGEDDDYYNVVFSDKELSIESGRLYAVTTKANIVKASDVFVDMMQSLIVTTIVCSVIVFAVVMYMMMKVMIDRAAFHISMVKVFGYRMNEIRKLYLNGNFYIIAVGAAICLPLSKLCMDKMYPFMVSNVACAMDLSLSWKMYVTIYIGIILVYLVVNQLLLSKLKKVNLAEVLKNRE